MNQKLSLDLTFDDAKVLLNALHQSMIRAYEVGKLPDVPVEFIENQINSLRERHKLAINLGVELKKYPNTKHDIIDSIVSCDGEINNMILNLEKKSK